MSVRGVSRGVIESDIPSVEDETAERETTLGIQVILGYSQVLFRDYELANKCERVRVRQKVVVSNRSVQQERRSEIYKLCSHIRPQLIRNNWYSSCNHFPEQHPAWQKRMPPPDFEGLLKVYTSRSTAFSSGSNHAIENNLFLVKRLVQRTEMRNPDPAPRRFTSLAWAAVLGHEETFEFLLTAGHDDEELSRVRPLSTGGTISSKLILGHII